MLSIDILQLNIWLDYAFATLYLVVLVAIGAHFLGNILTGRIKRRYKDWEWPKHDGPPVPFFTKFLHFQHLSLMIVLVLSGLYIRFPGYIFADWDNGRTFMRYIHYVAMIVVTFNSSMSAPTLCSALATAESKTFFTMCAAFLVLKASNCSACSTGMPRTWSATSRTFCAEMRAFLNRAVACMILSCVLGR